jgi:zinc protease
MNRFVLLCGIAVGVPLALGGVSGVAQGAEVVALPPSPGATVSMAIQFRAGAVDDPPGKPGLTQLTAALMAEGGTRNLDARQLADALFPMAARVDERVDKELTTFRTTVHRDHLSQMVGIFSDVVAHPRWDESEFARLRTATVNDVEKRLRQGDDENLGKEALAELLYRGHPYGHLTRGHLAGLRSITLDEVKAQAARVFTRDRLVIGVAGAYPADLPKQLDEALASLPATGAPSVAIKPQKPVGPRIELVEKDTASTAISIGFPWQLSRKDPDFVAMTIARSAFGEHRQFNGRLMQRLREARGLNYGDYAYVEFFQQEMGDASQAQTGRVRHQQDFTIWLRPVQNENRLFAARAALYELERSVADEPFTDEEVEATKSFLAGYTLLFAQTDARRLGYALDDKFLGTSDFLAGWQAKLASVTTAEVNAAWRKWLDPKQARIVMVTPNAAEVQQAIVANQPSPMHYQKDAKGQSPAKPAELLARDAKIEKLPLGAKTPADVEVVPVSKLFD